LSNCVIESLGNFKILKPFSITQLQNSPITQLFHFFMRRMLPAPGTELFKLQPVRLSFAVLRRRIIPLFAITALHCNDLSGHTKPAPKLLALKTCFLVWRGRPRP
jgi:hypothetical protein